MKKFVVTLLIFLGLVNIAALWHLTRKQKEAQGRLEETIQKEIDERWQIAQDVRQQVESKKQARDFIMRMDYEKEMQDHAQKLEGYKSALDELGKISEERINALQENHNQLKDLMKQSESQFTQKFEGFKSELDALSKKNEEGFRDLRASNKQVKGYLVKIESYFDRKFASLEKKISQLSEELAAVRDKIPSSP
jgi:uncharacterized phage infection (PIP) family protein YhgE